MIQLKINSKQFNKDMKNLMGYSLGFLEGAKLGKTQFLKILGKEVIEVLKSYVDSNARVNPEMLHHIYEWNMVGSPDSRLFDIEYTVSNLGLSIRSSFTQSKSVKQGSTIPFYDKARIMEDGIPVTIRPKKANVLAFESDGETIFTKGPIEVLNPGGVATAGGFEKIFDSFFNRYFSQAFLYSSGIAKYLQEPVAFKNNFSQGKSGGRNLGVKTGYRWIVNAGVLNGRITT